MTFLDFCAGIGGFRLGLEYAGHKCIGFCEKDKYAVRSYRAMFETEGEWYSDDIKKLRSEEIPTSDIWTFGFPCFEKDTLVMTDKGYKKIRDIKPGDNVLTHKNRFKPVVKPMKKFAKEIFELDIFGVQKLKATKEHPFYVRKISKDINKTNRSFGNPEWVAVEDLDKDCYIGIPINNESKLPQWSGITYQHHSKTKLLKNMDFRNKQFWWLVGRYMADGWYRVFSRKDRNGNFRTDGYRIIIACGKHKITELLDNIEGLFNYTVVEERTAYKIHICNKELTSYLMQFSHGASNKRLTNDILDLPVDLLKSFIEGYLSGDGCKTNGNIKVTTTSKELAYGIQAAIHKAYKRPCALYLSERPEKCVIEGRVVNQKNTYQLVFKLTQDKQDRCFYENEFIWVNFKDKVEMPYNDFVYNMEVQDDNSYTAYNLAVHNCQDISVAGKQRGLRGERSGIYFSIIDLIKGKEEKDKPTFLLIENVKNLLSINNGYDFSTVLFELDQAGYDVLWQVLNSKDYGVPQNRERVFIVANLRSRGRREILPVSGENSAALKQVISGAQAYRVYDSNGISCTLSSNAGGVGAKTGLYFIDQSNSKVQITDTARCITSRYTAGIVNRTAMNSGVLEAYPVLTPDRAEKRQNGRRIKNADEPMFTLTGLDRHGVAIKEATKKGYSEAKIGDSINISFPESKTRRGRVGINVAQTLDTQCMQGTLTSGFRIRRLTPRECFRLQGFPDELFERAQAVNSDAQLYKQAGNAVTVNAAYYVARTLDFTCV